MPDPAQAGPTNTSESTGVVVIVKRQTRFAPAVTGCQRSPALEPVSTRILDRRARRKEKKKKGFGVESETFSILPHVVAEASG